MDFVEKIKKYALNKKKDPFILTLFSKIFVFLLIFFVVFVILYFLLVYFNGYSVVSRFFAIMVYSHFSYNKTVSLDGTSLDFNNFQININDVCSGAYELILFIALIFACFEVKLWKRLVGALVYFVVFIIFNFVRIITIIYSLAYFDFFSVELLHIIFFKFGFFVFTFLFFSYFLIATS